VAACEGGTAEAEVDRAEAALDELPRAPARLRAQDRRPFEPSDRGHPSRRCVGDHAEASEQERAVDRARLGPRIRDEQGAVASGHGAPADALGVVSPRVCVALTFDDGGASALQRVDLALEQRRLDGVPVAPPPRSDVVVRERDGGHQGRSL
jgi:hypothetical protein